MKHRTWLAALMLVIVAGLLLSWSRKGARAGPATVRVERGTIVRNATAVGRIEVPYEVPVNSLTGGILTKLYVDLGEPVTVGQPLAEVRPVLTQQTLLQAERDLEQARIGEQAAREYVERDHPAAYLTRFFLGRNSLDRMYQNAELAREQAEERLNLLQRGEASAGDRQLDYVVRAPVSGHVLDIRFREGSPIVPSSLYGSGSEFLVLADLDHLVFRGTVDEIDAGRLQTGKRGRLTVGSLRDAEVTGELVEIALKSSLRDNATVFRVLMEVETPPGVTLRSGYSAVAEIEVDRRDDVLVLPERVVDFRDRRAFVTVAADEGRTLEKPVQTGLSDGLTVEITGGLVEGEEVIEPVAE
ncbi:MAG: efflux RND transporter periplasmic adaptor subunit [Verrucomicrobiales bacterium]|nr:efflux RND transporter periplasmic adaptor subunit [Verrucomicrobiales bacterium]